MNLKKDKLFLGSHVSGNDINIYYYSLDFGLKGPQIYIQSGMHGGEVTYRIINELISFLQNTPFRGKIVFVPCANPFSWYQKIHYYTIGKYNFLDGNDWNRSFGVDTKNTSGIVANAIIDIIGSSDFIIDLHTARRSDPFTIVFGDKYFPLLKKMGIKYNFILDNNDLLKYSNTLSGWANKNDIKNITIECGSHDDYNILHVNSVKDAIINLMCYYDMLDEAYLKYFDENQFYYNKIKTYYAQNGGFVKFIKNIGDSFNSGDILYEIFDLNDVCSSTKIFAKEDGIINKISNSHIYNIGDEVIQIIPLVNLHTF